MSGDVVQQYLDELAECGELNGAPLPSPELIWWRSQLAHKRGLAQRSVFAIETVRIVALIVSAAFTIVATLVWGPQLFAGLPVPLPLTVASLLLFVCSTGGVLLVWARQR